MNVPSGAVIAMPANEFEAWLAAQTPVAIVRSATCPDQATFVTTLEDLSETVRLQQVLTEGDRIEIIAPITGG